MCSVGAFLQHSLSGTSDLHFLLLSPQPELYYPRIKIHSIFYPALSFEVPVFLLLGFIGSKPLTSRWHFLALSPWLGVCRDQSVRCFSWQPGFSPLLSSPEWRMLSNPSERGLESKWVSRKVLWQSHWFWGRTVLFLPTPALLRASVLHS